MRFKEYFLVDVKEGDLVYLKIKMEKDVILKGKIQKIDSDGFWMEDETNYHSEEFVSYADLDFYQMRDKLEWAIQ